MEKCLQCDNTILNGNLFCSDSCRDKSDIMVKRIEAIIFGGYLQIEECPKIINCDIMTEEEKKFQKKWVNKNKRKAKKQMIFSRGII